MSLLLLSNIVGMPWSIHESAMEVITSVCQRAPVDEQALDAWKSKMSPPADALAVREDARLPGAVRARVRDGVAIVPVSGPIFRYANLITDHSGATSLASFAADLTLAVNDAKVKAILLEINSPGGEVVGMAEAAQLVRAASASKPVVAYTEGMMASAAYQIGAAARQIVVAPTANLGSLGVVVTMTDRSAADSRSGVVRHEIVSSQTPNKRLTAGTDEGRARIQALADRTADEFLADVALSRGTSIEALLDATGGGGLVIGRDAVARGLADRIAGFEETLQALAAGSAPPDRRRGLVSSPQPQPKEANVAETSETVSTAAPPPVTTETVLVASANANDAMLAERARAAAIQRAVKPGYQALAALAIDNGWTAEVFGAAQSAAADGNAAALASGLAPVPMQATFAAPVPAQAEAPAPATAASGPDGWAAEWDASSAVRTEFRTKESYVAFKQAETAGHVRMLRRA